jgi:hypothetical protein
MKCQVFSAITVLIILSLLVLTNVNATGSFSNIQTYGTINYNSPPLTVIVRQLGNPMPSWTGNINQSVDAWVRNYTWIEGGAVIIDVEDPAPILWFNQKGYGGYVFNTTYGTWSACEWTFAQLEQLINRFHYWNVRVILGITAITKNATGSDWVSNIYNWAVNNHLVYTHPDGSEFLSAEGGYSAPLDWFANFSSNDPASGAIKGETVYQLFETRLGQMINAGLQWDGIFGSEGWGSVGNWLATDNSFIDATANAVNQWANSSLSFHPSAFPPSSWSSKTLSQKVKWIQANATSQWCGYWDMRYARDLFKGVHDVIQADRPAQWFVGDMFSPDDTWMSGGGSGWGGWFQGVGYNSTYLAQYCSSSTYLYWCDEEAVPGISSTQLNGAAEDAKVQAYVAASVKGSSVNFHVVAGCVCYPPPIPIWLYKQEWLAEAQDYVWINGTIYKAVDPSIVVVQYPDNSSITGYFRSVWNQLFTWIKTMLPIMTTATPVWLGPTYMAGTRDWNPSDNDWSFLNYTFAQWAFSDNYANNPQYLNFSMNTLYIPSGGGAGQSGSQLFGWQNEVLNSFANGSLNVIFTQNMWIIGSALSSDTFGAGASESASMSTFHLISASNQSTNPLINVYSQTDKYAKWIASSYVGNTYTYPRSIWLQSYKAASGYINIANITTSKISNLGIYYNSTSGRFVYMAGVGAYGSWIPTIPVQIPIRAIQWASKSPINSSEPLLDYKVFKQTDGTILIPMMNHRDMSSSSDMGTPISSTLNINSTALGLGPVSNYIFYWASNGSNIMTFSSWNDVAITLKGMADALVIKAIS